MTYAQKRFPFAYSKATRAKGGVHVQEYKRELQVWLQEMKETYMSDLELRQANDDGLLEKIEALEAAFDKEEEDLEELYVAAMDVYKEWSREEEDEREERKDMKQMLGLEKSGGRVPIGGHTLPPLPYDYGALEPYISKEIMRLHHTKHHQSYVDGLNKAEKELEKSRKTGDFELVKHWERELAFHGAGHYLHTIFWNVMCPRGGGVATRDIGNQINLDFGSFDQFKKHFSEAAKNVEGVGWTILVWAPRSHRLEILTAEKHQNLSQWDVIPLLPLDVWEHAYYLQYKNEREEYIKNWWNVVSWSHVNDRFSEAKKVKWTPY